MGRPAPTHVDDAGALGRRLRRRRVERGLSLARLAFPGCSASFLCKVEAGERVPSPAVATELARRLEMRVEDLTGRDAAGAIPAATILVAEMASRLGEPDGERLIASLESAALAAGDRHARSRALEARGLAAIERRADEAAIAALEEARDCDPAASPRMRPTLYEALGRAYAGTGDLSRSIAILRGALDDALAPPADVPGAVRFGVYLASAYTDQGRFSDAEQTLADLLTLEPRIADPTARARVQWTLARTYAEQGRLRLAERYGREVVAHLAASEQSALHGRAHLLLGQILLDQRRRAEAEAELGTAGRLMAAAGAGRPELAMLDAELGRAALLAGDVPGARLAARRALDETEATEPAIAGAACLVLARAALADDDLDEARFLCGRAVRLLEGTAAPHYRAEAHQVLALVEERAGNLSAALDALWNGVGAVDGERRT